MIGACFAGVVCGLVPLIVGIVRKRVVLGVAGFATTAVAGLILGLILAIPSAIVWTIIIFAVGPGGAAPRKRQRRAYEGYDDREYDDRDFLPPRTPEPRREGGGVDDRFRSEE